MATHRASAERLPTNGRSALLALLAVGLTLTLSACGGSNVSRAEADALRERMQAIDQRLDRVEHDVVTLGQIAMSDARATDDQTTIDALLATTETEMRTAKDALGDVEQSLLPPRTEPDIAGSAIVSLDERIDELPPTPALPVGAAAAVVNAPRAPSATTLPVVAPPARTSEPTPADR